MNQFQVLLDILASLRNPESGCPWDIKQTRESLVPNFIEELYEAVEAIEDKDTEDLKEELGDLLLHIVFQAQISAEEGLWNMDDVIEAINRKLIRRHPHVFEKQILSDADEVKMNWERIKKKEKTERQSVLDGIPIAMPALIQAQRTQEKAASVGFDWADTKPVLEKLDEEREELYEALALGDEDMIKEELGDMIFTLVNLARKLHIDSEAALKDCTRKFTRRFHSIEAHYKNSGADINEASLEELDSHWEKAKKR
ncbi:MAG: nucleoside triphosphate pyrophosphohydrolase [Candidatus Cloacimonetes bacterium]|nr:nucleoside triphosphate pyrophosphohydrolase [Candidatus Cloacimonadota bacterium]